MNILFKVLIVLFIIIGIFMLLIVIGSGKCKTEKEMIDEDIEQSRIVSSDKYKNRKGVLSWICQKLLRKIN